MYKKFLFLLFLAFQVQHIHGMQWADMPMDVMITIVRYALYKDTGYQFFEENGYIANQNDMDHTVKRNYQLQQVSKDFKDMFWGCFATHDFTLQDKNAFISRLLSMWNQADLCITHCAKGSMPPIANIAVNIQASLYPILRSSIATALVTRKCNPEFVRVILDSGKVDKIINERCNKFSLLTLAVLYRHFEIVKLLLTHPTIDVNASMPLYWAVYHGRIKMVKVLLAHPQIKVNAVNDAGETALFAACRTASHCSSDLVVLRSFVDLLINAGADYTIKNKQGNTVLDIACDNNRINVVDVFEQAFVAKKNNL